MNANRVKNIVKWIGQIEKSDLSVVEFWKTNSVPFSRAQYFKYKKRLQTFGLDGLMDRRSMGRNRKVTPEHELFIKGYIQENSEFSLAELQRALMGEFQCNVSARSVRRALQRIDPKQKRNVGRPPKAMGPRVETNTLGGFELSAVPLHLHLQLVISLCYRFAIY
jgi:transposase